MTKRLPKSKTDYAAKRLMKKGLSIYLSPDNFPPVAFEFGAKGPRSKLIP
jgi:predicted DNA binding CopG/RHH family protein